MSTSFTAILMIIENPFIKKGYEEFQGELAQRGREQEAAALDYLIARKFHDNNPSSDQEPRE